ncbi:MAG: cell wall metabolism sensor histidine kinase WalK [Leuconostoc gelidum]|jgi:two-component system sensor histidine kinase VicK|uniref:histidine kinase n=1 Tax=Leuconostoc gelidum subsp. gelidum TaxID=1607839 RepID=A0AB35G1M1_LEUGE|nr:cell wall metabolism sensor histidine kinase WalK [Leuconostoc gelidum]AFS39738.1 two-component sensor kinase [Leuconostoc gelidum JB7]MBZ5964739.1 cell wall metabolism sensor histidine kinase WalK [Leuconostoc gelidum subsp. gelidum]MBZ5974656.1 cell wall metabolism sensor histidine kinase WalK [Leuconostoc gelidum subsp. gelidum]MBZ5977496.1 cell wall metabolism sensor histidine kinase WalK [Leuconostoc gelidum subsp. gelidum]MBZ5979220.1 cell wall metabolism sensor histidine kinase WalK 
MNIKTNFFKSIRFRITLVFVLLMIIALELLGAFFVRQIEQQNLATFQQQMTLPKYVTDQITTALRNRDVDAGNHAIQDVLIGLNNTNLQEAQVIDKTGTIRGTLSVSGQQTIGQKTTDLNAQRAVAGEQSFLTSRTISESGERKELMTTALGVTTGRVRDITGVVVVKASLLPVYRNVNSVMRLFVIAGLAALFISIALALFLARTLTRPIAQIDEQTTKIAGGDYSMVNHIYGSDELGHLAQSVNELSTRVEESTETVNAERNRLDSVLTHMADGVLAANRRGEITIINQAAANFVGIDREAAIGQNVIDLLHLQGKRTLRDMLENLDDFRVDLSDDSTDILLQAYVSLIKRQSGFISGLVVVLHNITEQQRIDSERRMFVSNVSHELRTPLTSVRSYVDALAEGAIDDPEMAQNFLGVVQDETQRMIRMINDLLSLSRLDQGTMDVRLEVVNLNSLFNFVLNRFDMIIESDAKNTDTPNKNYNIQREFTNEDVWVEVDPDKFTQVLDNIMNNAVKYSPDGGIITARLIKTKTRAILSISDQGLGIPRKDLDSIFNRFFRVDKSRSRAQGGTGLGLAISKEVVERFNGRIWVDSVENRGSTFYISLAYVDDDVIEEGDWDAE